jgi:hypothetical protein
MLMTWNPRSAAIRNSALFAARQTSTRTISANGQPREMKAALCRSWKNHAGHHTRGFNSSLDVLGLHFPTTDR